MSFKDNLKNELTYQGILVKELSLKTGINKRTLDNYLREKGSMPPADYAVKIAKALNTTVEYLVTGKYPSVPKSNKLNENISLFSKLSKDDQTMFLKLMGLVAKNKKS